MSNMKYWYLWCLAGLAFMGLVAFAMPKKHKVTYTVHGLMASQYFEVGYLDTPAYGTFQKDQLKSVRVPASSLPWSVTVYLPEKSIAWLEFSNENAKVSHIETSISVDGGESLSVPTKPREVESVSQSRIVGVS